MSNFADVMEQTAEYTDVPNRSPQAQQQTSIGAALQDQFNHGIKQGYAQGYEQGAKDYHVTQQVIDKRTNELLNQLYHERARLERELGIASDIMYGVVKGIKRDIKQGYLKDSDCTWNGLIGMLELFVEVNGD